jgi:hypothetical protein
MKSDCRSQIAEVKAHASSHAGKNKGVSLLQSDFCNLTSTIESKQRSDRKTWFFFNIG